MPDDFNAYHKWLAIPPEEQPPDHYRLLGLKRFEADEDVIANAADQRMAHLRCFQTGRHGKLSQQLLNEVAAAKLCLLNAGRRAEYDALLREAVEAAASPERTAKIDPPPPAPAPPALSHSAAPPMPAPPAPGEDTGAKLNDLFSNLSPDEKNQLARARKKLRAQTDEIPKRAGRAEEIARRAARRNILVALLLAAACLLGVMLVGTIINDGTGSSDTNTGKADEESHPSPPPPPGTNLVLLWPAEERRQACLVIDGRTFRISSRNVRNPRRLELALQTGKHSIRIVRAGYKPFEKDFILAAGKDVQIPITLEPEIERKGRGLLAQFFADEEFQDKLNERIDANLQWFWGREAPDEFVPGDKFWARWSGWLKAPQAGRYKLVLLADDGVRLWLDDREVISRWNTRNTPAEVEVELTGRPQKLKLEYFDAGHYALLCFNWRCIGVSCEQAVPHQALFLDEETARQTGVSRSLLRPVPSGTTPPLAVDRPIDLLALIDPTRHTVKGRWWFDKDALVCWLEHPAMIEIPLAPPAGYQLRLWVKRLFGNDALGLNQVVGGKAFSVVLDAGGGRCSGLECIDGKRCDNNETKREGAVFVNNRPASILCGFDESRVSVSVDTQTTIDWKPDCRRCSLHGAWTPPNPKRLSIGAWGSIYRIHGLELTPTTVNKFAGNLWGDNAMAAIVPKACPLEPLRKIPPVRSPRGRY